MSELNLSQLDLKEALDALELQKSAAASQHQQYLKYLEERSKQRAEQQERECWRPRGVKLRQLGSGLWELRWSYIWDEANQVKVKMRQSLEGTAAGPEELADLLKKIAEPAWGKRLAAGEKLQDLLMEEAL